MNKQPKTLEEKIKLSEELVDKYLDEFVTAAGTMAGLTAITVGQGLARDAAKVADWTKRKIEERKRKKMLAQQEKEKASQNAMRQK